ncbi:SprT-like domain-containing protein [Pseudomonas sp. Marseille-Q5115]|uniref:SprT-like domain-containing protein n=1 Tax=Pseudomonas sp. Marseille-Q5115 TaxID=2866593 RepID=UPI001CE42778|nr:SprT-like domain-containing protein [Pseudomonas sp. Marseille-Q5115]
MVQITPTIEVYTDLQRAFAHFNATLFDDELPACMITLQREKRTMGYFSPQRFARRSGEMVDEIAMNPSYFILCTIHESLSVLAHEMVHMWQYHKGTRPTAGYHNKEWAARMETVGLMPSSTGEPGGDKVGYVMDHYIIPGGRFDVACAQLVTERFQLQWFDRFPPERPRPATPLPQSGKGYVDDSDDEADLDIDLDLEGVQIVNEPISSLREPEPSLPDDLVQYPSENPKSRSNRCKYRCPKCGAQVWGKPELLVSCDSEQHEGSARMEFVREAPRPLRKTRA